VKLLKRNPEKISWWNLSINTNTEAVELLKQNPDKIDWANLSGNTNAEAVELLKQNPIKSVGLIYRATRTRKRCVEKQNRQNQLELFIA
jgi:ribosomal protein L24E